MNYVMLLIFWLLIDTDCVFVCFLLFLNPVFFIILYYVYDFIINI